MQGSSEVIKINRKSKFQSYKQEERHQDGRIKEQKTRKKELQRHVKYELTDDE